MFDDLNKLNVESNQTIDRGMLHTFPKTFTEDEPIIPSSSIYNAITESNVESPPSQSFPTSEVQKAKVNKSKKAKKEKKVNHEAEGNKLKKDGKYKAAISEYKLAIKERCSYGVMKHLAQWYISLSELPTYQQEIKAEGTVK